MSHVRIQANAVFHQSLSHQTTDLEFHGSLRRHVYALQRFGILRHSGGPNPAFKNAEVAKFQTVAVAEFRDDLIQELLNHLLDNGPFVVRPLCDPINQVLFGDRGHTVPLNKSKRNK